jgi:hypothetical protein
MKSLITVQEGMQKAQQTEDKLLGLLSDLVVLKKEHAQKKQRLD